MTECVNEIYALQHSRDTKVNLKRDKEFRKTRSHMSLPRNTGSEETHKVLVARRGHWAPTTSTTLHIIIKQSLYEFYLALVAPSGECLRGKGPTDRTVSTALGAVVSGSLPCLG